MSTATDTAKGIDRRKYTRNHKGQWVEKPWWYDKKQINPVDNNKSWEHLKKVTMGNRWYGVAYAEVDMEEGTKGDMKGDIEKDTEESINNPTHYQLPCGVEAIDIINDVSQRYYGPSAYYIGNTLKYLLRSGRKGTRLDKVMDLKKAMVYLEWLIKEEGGGEYVPSV